MRHYKKSREIINDVKRLASESPKPTYMNETLTEELRDFKVIDVDNCIIEMDLTGIRDKDIMRIVTVSDRICGLHLYERKGTNLFQATVENYKFFRLLFDIDAFEGAKMRVWAREPVSDAISAVFNHSNNCTQEELKEIKGKLIMPVMDVNPDNLVRKQNFDNAVEFNGFKRKPEPIPMQGFELTHPDDVGRAHLPLTNPEE